MGASALVARTPGLHGAIAALVASIEHGAPDPTVSSRAVYAHHLEAALCRVNQQSSIIGRLVHRCSIQASMLWVLASLSESLRTGRDREGALRDAIDSVVDAGGLSKAAVYLSGEASLELAVWRGFDESARELLSAFATHPLLRGTLEAERPTAIPVPEAALEALRIAPGFAVLVPLLLGGERLGALLLASATPPLAEDDLTAFARAVAAQMAHFLRIHQLERRR
jgi:hypothetical protein